MRRCSRVCLRCARPTRAESSVLVLSPNFRPAVNDIKTLYYQKFRGGGGKGDAELDTDE